MVALLLLSACSRNRQVGQQGARVPSTATPQTVNIVQLYRDLGLIAAAGPIPFVGRVAFLPDGSADSTLVMISVSLPSRSLSFARDGESYSATYNVRLELRRGATLVRQIDSKETVRVATFRETSRTDESIIYQQFVRLPAGGYTLSIGLRDEGSVRSSAEEATISVPRLLAGRLGSPIPVYEAVPRGAADSLPRLLARPRASVIFGVDTILPVYIEAGGTREATRVGLMVVGESNAVLWRDSTVLLGRGGDLVSGMFDIPVSQIGIGSITLSAYRSGTNDTARTRLQVSLGDDLPVASFDEMIAYLRYFAPAEKLRRLQETQGVERAQEWAEFLKATDPFPSTPEHEGLRDYFARIRLANQRFRDDGPLGWQSDRGMAFVALGDPDNIFDSGNVDPTQRVRQQVWEYRQWRLQLVFIDPGGFGRWRLTSQGTADLQATIRRKLSDLP